METLLLQERSQDSGWSPTRLEGMETKLHARQRPLKDRLRPALRGWKQPSPRYPLELFVESPTRLEGMETFGNHDRAGNPLESPTRLEGMET